jgi:hypothetical protein
MAFNKLNKILNLYPLASQATMSGFLFAFGDIIAQNVYEPKLQGVYKNYDLSRTCKMAIYGSVIAVLITINFA